jgi:hypothetical protein
MKQIQSNCVLNQNDRNVFFIYEFNNRTKQNVNEQKFISVIFEGILTSCGLVVKAAIKKHN